LYLYIIVAAIIMETDRALDTLQLRVHHASEIRADPALARTISTCVNDGYRYMSPKVALSWDPSPIERFPTANSIHESLGEDGIFAVLYDGTTAIACAAVKKWIGGFKEYLVVGEEGWEVVAVTTQVQWMRRGLAGRCVDALIEELIRQAREDEKRESGRKLQVWIHAIEDLYGPYWKKKGWKEVRAYERPVGDWGSKLGYRLLVLLQEFEV
jgi:hypothetical protein